jgi:hypothetical protein
MPIDLYQHRKNEFSQNGEDGIIEALLAALGIADGYFVEFGAWDGKHWSNTFRLYEAGWSGCYIEPDADRFGALCGNVPAERVLKVRSFVEAEGERALDRILGDRGVAHVDLLSIDIDSDDLSVWEGIRAYRPAIVVIEYNSVIPFDTRFVNPKGKMFGNAALSIVESAAARGYHLVEGTDTNLIFVDAGVVDRADVQRKTLQEIRDQTYQLRYFFGYDGTLLHDFRPLNDEGVTEFYPVPWAMTMGCQPIPAFLRKVRMRANYAGILFFAVAGILRAPWQFLKLIGASCRIAAGGRPLTETLTVLFDKDRLTRRLKGAESESREQP